MTTIKKIVDEILLLYGGGDVTDDQQFDPRLLKRYVVQAINNRLKVEHVDLHLRQNEHVPPHAVIATYNNVAVESQSGDEFACTLLDALGLTTYWSTTSFEEWTASGGFWATFLTGIDLAVKPILSSGVRAYIIEISNVSYPAGVSASDVEAFINDCATGGYIEFVMSIEVGPTVFAAEAISDVTAESNTFQFLYTPSATRTSATSPWNDTHTTLSGLTVLTTYEDVTLQNLKCCQLTTFKGKLTLPAQPINLPRGIGVWRVFDPSDPHNPFIPVPSQQLSLLNNMSHNEMDDILGALTSYEYFDNKTLYFNQTVSALPQTVSIQLLVVDPDELGDTDLLPVPPEMEAEIIRETLELMGATPPPDKSDDENPAR